MAKKQKLAIDASRYGVGEWYGNIVAQLSPQRRVELAEKAKLTFKAAAMPCPFKQSAQEPERLCHKPGGVCSLVRYRKDETGKVSTFGDFVTVCPNRFWQDGAVFRWIGQQLLGTATPTLISEVEFLEAISEDEDSGNDQDAEKSEAVGRIDLVLQNPETGRWCAVELQAVYFSGKKMPTHLAQFSTSSSDLPWPDANRRPDWRSSGPKRLMPQLMTKIPTLRRWGIRMAVVVDKGFSESLGPMRGVKHISNSDIVWFVVDYDPKTGAIKLSDVMQTTLEDSMEGLTAGIALAREQFEAKLQEILTSEKPAMKKKVNKLS